MSEYKAIFAAGCFWGVEDFFSKIPGINSTKVGYSGGNTRNPSYEEVCSDKTGHAECVLIEFNPKSVSFETLLAHFWNCHDPTTLNRQGKDLGSQYRSAIFYLDDYQKKMALDSRKKISLNYSNPIVTEINQASDFFIAEDYHQNYFAQNEEAPYCNAVIAPKLQKFKKRFQNLLK